MRFLAVSRHSFLGCLAAVTIGWGVPVLADEACELTVQDQLGSEKFGLATLNKSESKLYWNGKDIELRLREFKVAEKLIRSAGHAFTFIELYEAYSGEPYDEDRDDWDTYNIVKVVLSTIRRKIKAVDSTFAGIKTVQSKVWTWDDGTHRNKIVRGKLTLYPDLSEVHWDNKKVYANPASYRLVEYLVKKGRECTNRELYLIHTGLIFIEVSEDRLTRTMNTKFYRMRMDFEKVDPQFKSLATVWGVGYEWKD